MWTSLLGLTAAILAAAKYSIVYLIMYILWISITRTIVTLLLRASGHRISPAFPLMLYFNQIYGSIVKIYVFFRLDKQSWTRQKTRLKHSDNSFQTIFNRISPSIMTIAAVSAFIAIILHMI
jgi:glycosyltransferase Alg8